jgi:hypothetical protein
MVVTLILILVSVASVLALAVVMVNREVAQATQTAMKQHGVAGCSLALIWMISGLAVAALWTVYAYQVRDWRFAAIVWIPIICRWIGNVAEKATRREVKIK